MNVFFMMNGVAVTPLLTGSILPGVTRDSVIQLLKHWNIPVEERKISVDEILEAGVDGTLREAFGTGTAAVISPIGELVRDNRRIEIHGGQTGTISQRLYDTLTDIQYGAVKDELNWTMEVKYDAK